jgi:MFS family permease
MYLGGMGVLVRTLVLGRMVDRLGEARLSALGIVVLAAGLAATGLAHDWPLLWAGFTLMPLGTAFLFPCVTGLLSRVVSKRERGLYMGVQHTFGGVSRVAFPIASGVLMDSFGVGVPFWGAALLVLATLPLARALTGYMKTTAPAPPPLVVPEPNITGEFPVAAGEVEPRVR